MSARQRLIQSARSALGIVPDRLLGRVLPGSLGWNPDAMVVAHAPAGLVRLFVGPVNSAGQGYRWARAAEDHLSGVGAVNLMTTNAQTARFGFPTNVGIPESGYVFAHGWQRRQHAAIVEGFTHVLLESGRYLYGSIPGRSPLDIVKSTVAEGLSVALLWHGTDIRIPSEHARWEIDSPFGENGQYPRDSTKILETNARERLRTITETELPVFVSTPGLLSVPRAQWLPVVVDADAWQTDEVPLRSERPVVAYVPSNSPMKGDRSVDQQLEDLQSEGLITYRRLEGVASSQMLEAYKHADIVLDQFRLGDYGVAACEAMAAGRVVVGHVHDEVRERVRTLTGRELPVVESRYGGVGDTIRRLIAEPSDAQRKAAEGPQFVRSVHDGTASARALAGFLGVPAPNSGSDKGAPL